MKNDTAAIIHDGWWTLKFFIVAALFVSSFWIPNLPTITGYMEFARYVSVLYLSYQAMLMLVVAYVINNGLVTSASKYEGGGVAGILLMALFAIFTIGNITWLIFQYIEFSACGGNLAIMIITTIIGTAMYGLVLLRSRPDASVFTSSLVFSYCLFLQWSAFSSDSVDTCNPFNAAANSGKNVRANTIMMMVIGLLFVFASLLVVASISKHEGEEQMATEMSLNAAIITKEEDSGEKVNDVEEGNVKKTAEEMHVFPITTQTIFFQILLTLSAIYYAMLLTNWGSPDYSALNNASFFVSNKTSYWCQLTAMWISMAIYMYSLLAPLIFPDRF